MNFNLHAFYGPTTKCRWDPIYQILLHMKCLHASSLNYMPESIEECEPKLDVKFVVYLKL